MAYPTSLDTIADGSLGRVKIDQPGKSVRSLDYDIPASEYNAVKSAVAELETAVGLPDGNGDAFTRIATLESGTFAPNSIQTFSSSPGNVASTTALARVTYAGGTTTLDLSDLSIGQMVRIVKANASAYGFSVKGGASDLVNGGTAGAAMTVPWSTEVGSASNADPSCIVYRASATSLRVFGASSGLAGGGGGDATSIRGQTVSATAPTAGQQLVYSGSQYAPKSLFVSQTRDPISTDTGYELGTTWLNSTRSRIWQYVATGEWVCLSDPGLIWEWDPAQGTAQLDFVDDAGFTRNTGNFTGNPTTSALLIKSGGGLGTNNAAFNLVKTAQLPPSFWTAGNSFLTVARFVNNNGANTIGPMSVGLYYDATHFQGIEEGNTSGVAVYRNGSSTITQATTAFSGAISIAGTVGVTRVRRFSFVLPTGSTDPQVTAGAAIDSIGSAYTTLLASPDASWRGLTGPRVGWGWHQWNTASVDCYIGAMQIRRPLNGGA